MRACIVGYTFTG